LKSSGYKIIKQNYKTRCGEIDIVAKDKDVICFVEVKARHSIRFGQPSEAVNFRKQRQISKVAILYLKTNNLLDKPARFDVLELLYEDDKPVMSLFKNAFELNANFTL